MANSDSIAEKLDNLKKQLPEGINMEEFMENVSRLANEFMENKTGSPIGIQAIVFLIFLLIPVSLILFCFCKILNSQKKRQQGKEKKKQKEKGKDSKKKA